MQATPTLGNLSVEKREGSNVYSQASQEENGRNQYLLLERKLQLSDGVDWKYDHDEVKRAIERFRNQHNKLKVQTFR